MPSSCCSAADHLPRQGPFPGSTATPTPIPIPEPDSYRRAQTPTPSPTGTPHAPPSRGVSGRHLLGFRDACGGVAERVLEARAEPSMRVADLTPVVEIARMQLSRKLMQQHRTQQQELVRTAKYDVVSRSRVRRRITSGAASITAWHSEVTQGPRLTVPHDLAALAEFGETRIRRASGRLVGLPSVSSKPGTEPSMWRGRRDACNRARTHTALAGVDSGVD